jgi:hypothetical protein
MAVPEFSQFVEYIDQGGIQDVALNQHQLDALPSLRAVVRGYVHTAQLGRPLLASEAEIAMVLSEWSPAAGLPANPGIVASKVLAGWIVKSVAAAYVIATSTLLDQINATRTVAIAFVRLSLVDEEEQPLAPNLPFTSQQIQYLSTWINDHNITNTEFAALFGVTAVQLSAWLQSHPRHEFIQVLAERFA